MPHVTRGHRAWSLIAVGVLLATWVAVAQQGRPVNDAVLRTAPTTGEEWLTYGLDLGEKRFSPLNQINTTNVSRLGLAWSYDIPGTFGNPPGGGNQEATPLMWNGTLYGITTWSVVFAVDARTGKQLWTWDPQVNRPAVQPKVCCGIVNRGVAIYEGKIIAPIIDGRLVALDAMTGKARLGIASRVSAGAIHAHDGAADREGQGDHRRQRIRVSGARIHRRLRATTGQRAWRFYTVPGDPAKGFENDAMRKAAETWSGEWWKMGGGAHRLGQPGVRPGGRSHLLRDRQRRAVARSRCAAPRAKTTCTCARSSRCVRIPARCGGTTRWCQATRGTTTACSS